MKITDIDIERILPYSFDGSDKGLDEEEEKGFFGKLFSRRKKPERSFYETRIEEFGRDTLYDELKSGADIYHIDKTPDDLCVILTESFFILPGKEIFPLYRIKQFAVYNPWETPFEQYATDRAGIPYDPTYVSEYEEEESYELDRFNIRLVLIDDQGLRYQYIFPMEVCDRRDFRDTLAGRCDAEDHSSEDVLDGWFDEERFYRSTL